METHGGIVIILLLVLSISIPAAFAVDSDAKPISLEFPTKKKIQINFDFPLNQTLPIEGFTVSSNTGNELKDIIFKKGQPTLVLKKNPNTNLVEIIYDPTIGTLKDTNGDPIQGFKIIKPDPTPTSNFIIIFPYTAAPATYSDAMPESLDSVNFPNIRLVSIFFDEGLDWKVTPIEGFTVTNLDCSPYLFDKIDWYNENPVIFANLNSSDNRFEIIYNSAIGNLVDKDGFLIQGFKITSDGDTDNPTIVFPYSVSDDYNCIVDNSADVGKGGGGCSDCTPPTIGLNSKGERKVDDGLVLNGESLQVEYFKTPMPMQYTEIGKENHLQVKVYENQGAYNIRMVQFAMGIKEIGTPISEAQALLEIEIANFANDIDNPSVFQANLIDNDGIINEDYGIGTSLVQCMDGFNHECLQLDIFWTYDKVIENPVLALNGWDTRRNSFTDYFNDGLTVIDPNPITIDEPVEEQTKECKIYKVPTRNNPCQFNPMIEHEIAKATQYLENY